MSAFRIGPLNHVGVAVPSVDEAVETYRTLYGATDVSDPIDLPEQGVRVRFVTLSNSQIELIEPLGADSTIATFLEKAPQGGQHHVCFEVDDIWEAKAAMEARGARVLNEPRIGAHGTPIIFVHPKDTHGVLIELMETPRAGH